MEAFEKCRAQVLRATAQTSLVLDIQPWSLSPVTTMHVPEFHPYFTPHILVAVAPNGQLSYLSVETFYATNPDRTAQAGLGNPLIPLTNSSTFPVYLVRLTLRPSDLPIVASAAALGALLRDLEYNVVRSSHSSNVELLTLSLRQSPGVALCTLPTATFDMEAAYERCFLFLQNKCRPDNILVFLSILCLVRQVPDISRNLGRLATWLARIAPGWVPGTEQQCRPAINPFQELTLTVFFLGDATSQLRLTFHSGPRVPGLATDRNRQKISAWQIAPTAPIFAAPFEEVAYLLKQPMDPQTLLVAGHVLFLSPRVLLRHGLRVNSRQMRAVLEPYGLLINDRMRLALSNHDEDWGRLLTPLAGFPSLAVYPFEAELRLNTSSLALQRLAAMAAETPTSLPVCLVDVFRQVAKGVIKDPVRLWLGCLAGQLGARPDMIRNVCGTLKKSQLDRVVDIANRRYGRRLLQCHNTCMACSPACPIYQNHRYQTVLMHPGVQSILELS